MKTLISGSKADSGQTIHYVMAARDDHSHALIYILLIIYVLLLLLLRTDAMGLWRQRIDLGVGVERARAENK
jgi:hypothetical protein